MQILGFFKESKYLNVLKKGRRKKKHSHSTRSFYLKFNVEAVIVFAVPILMRVGAQSRAARLQRIGFGELRRLRKWQREAAAAAEEVEAVEPV